MTGKTWFRIRLGLMILAFIASLVTPFRQFDDLSELSKTSSWMVWTMRAMPILFILSATPVAPVDLCHSSCESVQRQDLDSPNPSVEPLSPWESAAVLPLRRILHRRWKFRSASFCSMEWSARIVGWFGGDRRCVSDSGRSAFGDAFIQGQDGWHIVAG